MVSAHGSIFVFVFMVLFTFDLLFDTILKYNRFIGYHKIAYRVFIPTYTYNIRFGSADRANDRKNAMIDLMGEKMHRCNFLSTNSA